MLSHVTLACWRAHTLKCPEVPLAVASCLSSCTPPFPHLVQPCLCPPPRPSTQAWLLRSRHLPDAALCPASPQTGIPQAPRAQGLRAHPGPEPARQGPHGKGRVSNFENFTGGPFYNGRRCCCLHCTRSTAPEQPPFMVATNSPFHQVYQKPFHEGCQQPLSWATSRPCRGGYQQPLSWGLAAALCGTVHVP